MQLAQVSRWGVDFGNVIVKNLDRKVRVELTRQLNPQPYKFADRAWLNALDKFLLENSSLVPEAITGLNKLIQKSGKENIWIISKADYLESLINRRLMLVHDLFKKTNLTTLQIRFVTSYQHKTPVCLHLNITGHIDDRGEVLFYMQETTPNLVWFNPAEQDTSLWNGLFTNHPRIVSGWDELIQNI